MIETAVVRHRGFQRILARMAEGWMADVVREAQGLGQILVEPQRTRDSTPDLCHLDTVSQADAIMVAVRSDEHLRLVAQAAKRDRMNDAVTVALEVVARASDNAAQLSMAAPATLRRIARAIGNAHLNGSTVSPASLLNKKPSPPAFL